MKYDLITVNPVVREMILTTVSDMFHKHLLPERSRKLIYDNIVNLCKQYQLSKHKEFSCTVCHFTARGPRFLLIQHQKIHADKGIKENEILRLDYKLY